MRATSVNDALAEVLNINPPRGVLVAFVDENGPPKLGGIQNGDVLLKFDGHDINEADDLLHMVSHIAVGQQVEIVLIRSGNEETHIVTIGRHNGG